VHTLDTRSFVLPLSGLGMRLALTLQTLDSGCIHLLGSSLWLTPVKMHKVDKWQPHSQSEQTLITSTGSYSRLDSPLANFYSRLVFHSNQYIPYLSSGGQTIHDTKELWLHLIMEIVVISSDV